MDINKGSYLGTPLICECAAANNRVSIHVIRFLIENGANVNDSDINGNSVLHLAVVGQMAVNKMILSKDISINIRNSLGEKPLAYLISHGGNGDVNYEFSPMRVRLSVTCTISVTS